MCRRFIFATAMVLVTALAFTGPASSEPTVLPEFTVQ